MKAEKKKLGIIGGMGSRAGANFLQRAIDLCPAVRDQEFIEILLHSNSSIPDRTRAIVYGEASPMPELLRSVEMMNTWGADYIVLTCNTSYYYGERLEAASRGEILSPIPLLTRHVKESGFRKIGLLATTGTLRASIFQQAIAGHDLELITLDNHDQETLFMRSVYMDGGLKSSEIKHEAYSLMHQSARKLLQAGAEVIIGGCSEVSLGMAGHTLPVPYTDTMDLLAKEVISKCYQDNHSGHEFQNTGSVSKINSQNRIFSNHQNEYQR